MNIRGLPVAAVSAFVLATIASAPVRANVAVSAGDCGWPAKADADRVNIAYPDQSAQYWLSAFAEAPGTELRFRGSFPHARYMSFHVYEGSIPIDHLTDAQIRPDTGSNPFLPGADRHHPGTYTVHVLAQAPPADPALRAPNTLYAGSGTNGEPLAAATILYRVYLGEGDITGGVGLPYVDEVLHTTGADTTTGPLPSCQQSLASASLGVNGLVAGESIPASWPGPTDTTAPAWTVARSGGSGNNVGPVHAQIGNPFFPNFDNTYLSLAVTHRQGDVVAFRAKAPTFTHTLNTTRFRSAQLRYWSFCTNHQTSTRFIACLPDQDVKFDAAGYLTVVISDPAHRPRNLAPTDNWLPWGPTTDLFVLYRHMLPAPNFAQAAQRVPAGVPAQQTMGDYYPRTAICSTATFERDRCGLPLPRSHSLVPLP